MDDGIFYKDAVEKPFPMDIGSSYGDVIIGGSTSPTTLEAP
jgi:hypothetical protein